MTSRGHRRRGRRDESGVALVVAIAVTFIVILLSLAALRQSTNGITQFGIANKQVSSIDASESGVQYELDAMNAAVTASASTFTCASSTTLGTGVTYHLMVAQVAGTTAPTASNLAACSGSVPLTAGDTYLFQSTGTTTSNAFGARTTQATIYVPAATGTTGTVFDQTVFGNTALNITNGLTVTGTAGGLYSNGNWSCATQQTVTGAVTIYGTSTLSQSCAISGNLWSSGSVSFDTGAYVTGWTETPLAASYTANTNGAHSGALYSGSRSGITCGSGQLFSSCTTYSSATAPTPTAKETVPTLPFVCATPSLANCGSSPWGSAWTVDNDTSCNFNNAVYDGSNGGTGTILYWPSACGTLTTPSNSTLPISEQLCPRRTRRSQPLQLSNAIQQQHR
jgi:Tfp pilus assembly protein PilX